MGLTAFDPDSSINGTPEAEPKVPKIPLAPQSETTHNGTPEAEPKVSKIPPAPSLDTTQAVAELLQQNYLAHTFGVHGEWEVRTTLVANRQAWRYRSSVLVHGKEIGGIFSPLQVDRTRQMRRARMVTEEALTAFAREAVEVHVARCTNVEEYSLLASIYSQPLPGRFRGRRVAVGLLCVAMLTTAYGLWRAFFNDARSDSSSMESVRWQSPQLAYHYPAAEPFVLPLPALERQPARIPVAVTFEASSDKPDWLELDRTQLNIYGTAPHTAAGQTYVLSIRAQTQQGSTSRLRVLLTITAPPPPATPAPQPETSTPRLRGHWTW